MRPTLFILIGIAGILVLYRVYVQSTATSATTAADDETVVSVDEAVPPPQYMLDPPAGTAPSGPAEILVSHEIRQKGPQTRLHIFLTEKHGWWVDRIYVVFWYQEKDPSTGKLTKYHERAEFIPKAVDFGETLEHAFVIFETDLPQGKPKGTTENWGVRVDSWDADRVRAPVSS